MAPNQLPIEPIRKTLHVQITWGFLPVGVILLFGTWLAYKVYPPGMKMTAAGLALSMTPRMMGIITPYATGPGPIYAVSGYLPAKDFCGWERPSAPSA